MAHIVFLSRGIKHDVDRMVKQLESLHLPMKAKDREGKPIEYIVQNHLQPIQLWSLVIPKEHTDVMCRTLQLQNQIGFTLPKELKEYATPKRKFSLAVLRKALGLKPVPEWKPEGMRFPIWKNNIHNVGIGVKEDYDNEYGNEAL